MVGSGSVDVRLHGGVVAWGLNVLLEITRLSIAFKILFSIINYRDVNIKEI